MAKFDGQKFLQFLKVKWAGRPCPMCGSGPWNVQDEAFELRAFQGGNLVLGAGPLVPVVVVTCQNCGNTMLVNAIVSGVVDREQPNITSDAGQ